MLFYVSEISEAGYNNSNLAATTVAKIKNAYKKRDTGEIMSFANFGCTKHCTKTLLTNARVTLSEGGVLGIAAGDQMTNCKLRMFDLCRRLNVRNRLLLWFA